MTLSLSSRCKIFMLLYGEWFWAAIICLYMMNVCLVANLSLHLLFIYIPFPLAIYSVPRIFACARRTLYAKPIFKKAVEVFMYKKFAYEWLATPKMLLGDKIPIVLMNTKEGAQIVKDEIERLESGVCA